LSYEAVALYLAAADLGEIAHPAESWPTCCKLRSGRNLAPSPDAAVLRYSAAAGLVLMGVKLDDDVRDSGSWGARALRWSLRRPIRRAGETLSSADPGLTERLAGCVRDHLEVERRGSAATLEETVGPTSEAFGHLFAGLSRALSGASHDAAAALRNLGERIGAAIIRYDCAVDRAADQARGEFNPLRTADDSEAAIDDAIDDLTTAAADWRETAGPNAELARLLEHRIDAIAGTARPKCPPTAPLVSPECRTRLEHAGVARRPGSVYAAVNPCAALEILECCAGIADCLHCLAPSHHGGCGRSGCGNATWCCTPCDELCGTSNTTGGMDDDSTSPLVGMTGKCITALKPNGMIRVAGVRRRAEAQGEHLPKGTKVVVIAAESFGLLVRRAD